MTARPATTAQPAPNADPSVVPSVEPPAEPARPPEIVLFDDVTTATVLDADALVKRYPALSVEEERNKGTLRSLSLRKGKRLVVGVRLDEHGHPDFGNIRGKDVEIAGTALRIGATFDEVAGSMPRMRCRAEYGESPWLICKEGPFDFTWVVGTDLENDPDLDLEQARTVVGRRRLESVQFSLVRD